MGLLITGIIIFTLAHLALPLAPGLKTGVSNTLGEKAWKGMFAAVVAVGLLTIIFGWRSTPVEYAYVAPHGLRHVTMLLMLIAFILFGAAKGVTSIQRLVRHPMLTAVLVWAVAHLLSNGETRSLALFGGLGIWAVLQMMSLNKRDGEWVKPEPAPMIRTLKNIIISIVVFLVVFMLHKYFTGVSLMPAG